MRPPRRILPNLPDVFLRRMFQCLTYRELCKAECVCRRWQNIVLMLMRRNIHEITIEQFGASTISAEQLVPLRRLTVTCPTNAFDFQAGIIRRSRLTLVRLTTDIQFLSNLQYVSKKSGKRRKKPFIKKLEIAGQCTLRGLQFLQNKAHIELQKRLNIAVPELEVDCEDIYYCW
ncbi:F-box domain protein [Necator americanus]|uniref:F-box domain protein n=1 Tax=Necator americanus TaxID=51031 RepID=W2TZR2_NECAM|nr:F-box domain protein [Necator americanus]ETN86566.1 F-box domain protein [Necator americanus]